MATVDQNAKLGFFRSVMFSPEEPEQNEARQWREHTKGEDQRHVWSEFSCHSRTIPEGASGREGQISHDYRGLLLAILKKEETTKDAKDTKTTDGKKQEFNTEIFLMRFDGRIRCPEPGWP